MTITHLTFQSERLDSRDLTVIHAKCHEGVGVTPSIDLELAVDHTGAGHPMAHFAELRGQSGVLLAKDSHGNQRQYSGVIQRLSAQLTEEGKVCALRLHLMGWPHSGVGYQKGSRFFQDASCVHLATEIFQSSLDTVRTEHLGQAPATRPYVVQFEESDSDFIARILLADQLLFRIDTHTSANGSNLSASLHLFRELSALPLATQTLTFTPTHSQSPRFRSGIFDLRVNYSQTPDAMALTVAPTSQPNVDLRVTTLLPASSTGQGAWIEVNSNAMFSDAAQGQDLAQRMLQARRAPKYSFRCNRLDIQACHIYSVTGLTPRSAESTQWALVSARQTFVKDQLGGWALSGEFVGLSPDDVYEPSAPVAPQLPGLLRGVVVAKANGALTPSYAQFGNDDMVDTDSLGRIRVRILWPGQAQIDEDKVTDAPWLRLMTPWAGQRAGFFALPRAGQEVIVSFINGDPAQPVVMGCLYGESDSAPSTSPWVLAEDAQWVGLGTRGGKKGQQYVRLDASASPHANQGIELQSASQLRMVAAHKTLLSAPVIEIGSSDTQKTASMKVQAGVLSVAAAETKEKSSGDWTHKGSSRTTFHAEFKTGGASQDVVGSKGEVVGVKLSTVGHSQNIFLSKSDIGVVGLKDLLKDASLFGVKSIFGGKKNENTASKTENTALKIENNAVKTENNAVETASIGVQTEKAGVANRNSATSLSNGGVDISTHGLTTIL